MKKSFELPVETVELPSQGLLYPETSPLASGKIEMKYMTAKEEDILTNVNYIKQGTVVDRLLESLIVTPIPYGELLVGDKNAIMVAARILSYGQNYDVEVGGKIHTVDLTEIKSKELDPAKYTRGKNEFNFTLPHTGQEVTFKLLTHADEKEIELEVRGLQKIHKDNITEVTTRLKKIITSINGVREPAEIRSFVDKYLLARDARALREEYSKISPDMDMNITIQHENGEEEVIDLPIGITFFWPDAK